MLQRTKAVCTDRRRDSGKDVNDHETIANRTRGWAASRHGHRNLRARSDVFHAGSGFFGLAGTGARTKFHAWQKQSWKGLEDATSGHTQPFDTWCHVGHYRSQPLWCQKDSWLERRLARQPKRVAVITLANRMARAIRAMMTKNEDYRNPEAVA